MSALLLLFCGGASTSRVRAGCRRRGAMAQCVSRDFMGNWDSVHDSQVLISGGGMAGVGAAARLVSAGVDVVLCEQGRGLGGRVCTRHVRESGLAFDFGAQYFAPKAGTPFAELCLELEREGACARWHATLGSITADSSGLFLSSSFVPWRADKTAYVGVPSMSSVGKQLLRSAAALPNAGALTVALGTRVAPGSLCRDGDSWLADTHAKGQPDARRTSRHRAVLALGSASSSFNVVAPVAPDLAAAAGRVQADCCWALMVAFASPLALPFEGVLVSGSPALAWAANNSSKPGRGTLPECWVVHAGAEWSNARREAEPREVAQQLLDAWLGAAGREASAAEVVHLEAFRWNAAFPLSVADSGGAGCFVDAQARLGLAGDWCVGPRAGDAWSSGQAAAAALLQGL